MVGVGVEGSEVGTSVGLSVGAVPVGSLFDVGAFSAGVVLPGIVGARIAPVTRPQAQAQSAHMISNTAKIPFFISNSRILQRIQQGSFRKGPDPPSMKAHVPRP